MPIRFRCAYCNQLMGIARRKAGSVVRCPKCSGQVLVPALPETEIPAVPSAKETWTAPAVPPPAARGGGVFERDDFSRVLQQEGLASAPRLAAEPPRPVPLGPTLPPPSMSSTPLEYDVEAIGGPIPIHGIFLTPGLLTMAGVLIVILMGASFFLGWIIGRS